MTRRTWLARFVMAAAAAPVIGPRLPEPVAADKKKSKQEQKASVDAYKKTCEVNGGTATTSVRPGGTTVYCTGQTTEGTNDWACTVTSQSERCHATSDTPRHLPTTTPGNLPDQPLEPLEPGDSPLDNPGQIPDQPLEPAGGDLTLAEDHTDQQQARRHGKRKRHGKKHRR